MADTTLRRDFSRRGLPPALAALALFLAAGCPRRAPAGPPPAAPPVAVRVENVVPGEFAVNLALAGVVRPGREATVAAEVDGVLERFGFAEGEWVECAAQPSATPLAEIDSRSLQARRDAAQAEADFAASAQERLGRMQESQPGIVSAEELERGESRRRAAAALLRLAEIELARARVRAPLAGVLERRLVEEGEFVNRGTPLARVVDLRQVKVVAALAERDAPFLELGDEAEVEEPAYLGRAARRYPGRVTRIPQEADERAHTFAVEVTVENPAAAAAAPAAGGRPRPAYALRAGMIVRVHFVLERRPAVISAPLEAVRPLPGGRGELFVVREGRAVLRPVALGSISGKRVEIREGLAAGEALIVSGQYQVEDGRAVEVGG